MRLETSLLLLKGHPVCPTPRIITLCLGGGRVQPWCCFGEGAGIPLTSWHFRVGTQNACPGVVFAQSTTRSVPWPDDARGGWPEPWSVDRIYKRITTHQRTTMTVNAPYGFVKMTLLSRATPSLGKLRRPSRREADQGEARVDFPPLRHPRRLQPLLAIARSRANYRSACCPATSWCTPRTMARRGFSWTQRPRWESWATLACAHRGGAPAAAQSSGEVMSL
jgi:hypothetical protein